ncbi:hypothetical protein GCM10010129_51760 [Streptomyces fumigatiscleroticus]|nr:hypothetical protein GCM10010129_51760 [Streptomyces fumigatiscleroticus]
MPDGLGAGFPGPSALTGAHRPEVHPEGRLPDIPGARTADGDAVAPGTAVGGGRAVPPRHGARPAPVAASPYDARRAVRMPDADVRLRTFPGLGAEPAFTPEGRGPTLRTTAAEGGSPRAVVADITSGNGGHRFRGGGHLAQPVPRPTAERRPCAGRSYGRILPHSACQGHGVFGIRTCGPPAAPHGPEPHEGPRLPMWRNEK